jgi:dTDP-glucose 4,6-dehydratase
MTIIITGCAGFIGTNFTRYWLERYPEDRVVGVDCLTYAANRAALDELRTEARFGFYPANICDRAAMAAIFEAERPDTVINFAAESHVDRSIESSAVFIESNVLGVQVLLDLCLAHGVGRFHQISTDEVYGDLPLDSPDAFTEDSPLRPSSPYSASKAAADLLTLSYHKTHGLSVSVSRSANNYGPYQHPEKLIPKAVQYALDATPFPIYGNGQNVRDWLHVLDHCRAVDLIVHHAPSGSIYNVGGGTLLDNLTLLGRIHRTLGLEGAITHVPDRKGHDRKYALSSAKLTRELGWRPEIPFDEGLAATVAHFVGTFRKA